MNSYKKKKIFSIIIPIYNSETYLKRCLESVVSQEFKDFEIILINDCSSDNSLKICNFFKKKNQKIRLINNKRNKGVSISRNKGLKFAKGEYLIFLDSDDYIEKGVLQKIYNSHIYKKKAVDIIIFNKNNYTQGKKIKSDIRKYITLKNNLYLKSDKVIKNLNYNEEESLFRRYIISNKHIKKNNIKFLNNVNYNEDYEFVCKSISLANTFIKSNHSYYNYTVGSGTLAHRITHQPAFDSIKVVCILLKFMKDNKFTNEKNKFILRRIYKVLDEFYPRLTILNKIQLDKLIKILTTQKNFLNVIKKIKRNDIFDFIKKCGVKNGIINLKKLVIRKIDLQFNDYKTKNFFLFGNNFYSKIMFFNLKSLGYKVIGIIDNNKASKLSIQGTILITPKIFKKRFSKIFLNSYIIVCNQNIKTINAIYNQLKKIGFEKNNLSFFTYRLSKKNNKSLFV